MPKRSFFDALGLSKRKQAPSEDCESGNARAVPVPSVDPAQKRPEKKKKKKQKKAQHNVEGPPTQRGTGEKEGAYPYEVDFCDHFETPADAYKHIEPLLTWLAQDQFTKGKDALRIYDPYYCDGAVIGRLGSLGFKTVINKKRDFYKDMQDKTIPPYDVCVTNPPYSGDHKERCVDYMLSCGLPSCALMPNYVANKQYYRDKVAAASAEGDVAYIVPTQKYEFQHPTGKGHSTSPFFSIWFLIIPGFRQKGGHASLSKWLREHPGAGWRLCGSVEELQQSGSAPAWRRPSNKKRKKLKALAAKQGSEKA